MKNLLRIFAVAMVALFATTSLSAQPKPEPKKQKAEIVTTTFYADVDCPSCVKKVNNTLSAKKGVKDVNVDTRKETITVKYDKSHCSKETIISSLKRVGINANTSKPSPKKQEPKKQESNQKFR